MLGFKATCVLMYLKEFSETTTLHGVRHIGLSNRHFIEVTLWVLCVVMAIYGSYNLMRNSWTRYNENPTVITVQKDYRYWYLQFPSATFCYVDPVDSNLAKDYIKRKWKVDSGEKFDYYMEFVKKLANTTYENLENMEAYVNNTELLNIDIIDMMLKYYVHYAKEVPDILDKYYSVSENMERDTTFTFWQMTSAPELKRLSPSQRQCRYMNEPMDNTIPVYSYNVCRMLCRRKVALEKCRCAPHFYPYSGQLKVCNIKGLYCLSFYKEMLMSLENIDGTPIKCNCLMQCEDVKLFLDRNSKRTWSYPVPWDIRFRWAVDKYSKTRLRRDVIYSFEDLLVSLGGTASFFLGCSVLSFIEIGYYLTLRLYWFINKKRHLASTNHDD